MFGPRAPTFPVLDCRSAGKLTSRGPSTTPMAPPGRSQDSGRWTGHQIIVATRECNFPQWWRFKFLPSFLPKLIKRWLTTDHPASNAHKGGGGEGEFWDCGLWTKTQALVAARTGQDALARDRGGSVELRRQQRAGPKTRVETDIQRGCKRQQST